MPKSRIMQIFARFRVAFPKPLLIFVIVALSYLQSAAQSVSQDVDWEEFIGRHDIIWQQAAYQMAHKKSREGNGGAFMGNGMIGAQVFYARY